jgi:hypothetical protein
MLEDVGQSKKSNLHVSKIQQTNVKSLLEGERKIRKDCLDYHNHNFFGLEMNLKWGGKRNSTLRLSTFKLFMLQWKLMGIVLKYIDKYQENSGLITNF